MQKPRGKRLIRPRNLYVTFLFLLLIIPGLWHIKLAWGSVTIYVPGDYPTIQGAVNNAANGDTIIVAADIYYEHVSINKSITLIGNVSNPHTTIIDGTANGTVLKLEAGSINITGFEICNAGPGHSGISMDRENPTNDFNIIVNNIITTSGYGVFLALSNRNTISNNTFFDNPFAAIYLNEATRNNLIENTISESESGIRLLYSADNTIEGNDISYTSDAIYMSDSSTDNTISYNTITRALTNGVFSSSDRTTVHHNIITDSGYGVYFYNNHLGSVYYNFFANNSRGIRLYMSSAATSDHDLSNNNAIKMRSRAIEMVNSYGNTIMGNWLQKSTYGAYLSSSGSNTFYRNNFINNSMQVYSTSANNWDMGGEGNYWSDYTGVDENPRDGIGDEPYPILPGYDYYPLMTTWSEHDIAIKNVTLSTSVTNPGAIVDITVTIVNEANISVFETFNVTVRYDLNIIGTQIVNNLAQGATTILTFNWNTTGVAPGNYTISAEASVVPDELNNWNNNFIDGTVKIEALLGDINYDGKVNVDDLILLMEAYGSTSTSYNWNPDADLNNDNIVDVLDLFLLGEDFGQTI